MAISKQHGAGALRPAVELPASGNRASSGVMLAVAGVLVVVTLALYARVAVQRFPFLHYDDQQYVFENPRVVEGLSWSGVGWAFSPSTIVASNWHPLTLLSHMLDCQIYGLAAWGHHLTNVLWHAVNTLLLFGVLHRMTGAVWRSALVAALFGWHPLHVESVAWVSERKDLLCAFWWLLGMWFYIAYVRRPNVWRYLPVASCLLLGLLSKPMIVTFPFALLLLDYWPLGRYAAARGSGKALRRFGQLFAEKLPMLVLVWMGSNAALYAQRATIMRLDRLSLGQRLTNAAMAYDTYLWKTIWPTGLATPYPLDETGLHAADGLMAAIPLLLTSAVAIAFGRRFAYGVVGWCWFLGTLVPVIGLVQVGVQSLADRYTYLPSIGLFLALAWGLGDLVAWAPRLKRPVLAGATIALLLLSAATVHQIGYWRDTVILLTHTLDVTGENLRARYGIARVLIAERRYDEALEQCTAMLSAQPDHFEAYYLQGLVYHATDRPGEAANAFAQTVRHGTGRMTAKQFLQLAIPAARTFAAHPDARVRDAAQAVEMAEFACQLTHYSHAEALDTLAAAYAEAGRFSEAAARAETAQKIAIAARLTELAQRIEQRKLLYRQQQPFRNDPVKSRF